MKNAPEIKTALPGPNAKAIIDKDSRFVSPSYTRDYPLVIARGEGAMVEDVDGNLFLDCTAGIAVNSTGASHPDVVKAISSRRRSSSTCQGPTSITSRRCGSREELAAIAPMTGERRSFFGNSGTEATEAALKLARYHTKRSRHHRVLRSLSRPDARFAVADRQQGGAAPRLRPVHARRVSRAVSRLLSLSGRPSADDVRRGVPRLHRASRSSSHLVSPDEVAAIVVEPIQGEGGYVVPPTRSCSACAS